MKSDGKIKREIEKSENILTKELDKGIDSMEHRRTMPHDKVMRLIREKLRNTANH